MFRGKVKGVKVKLIRGYREKAYSFIEYELLRNRLIDSSVRCLLLALSDVSPRSVLHKPYILDFYIHLGAICEGLSFYCLWYDYHNGTPIEKRSAKSRVKSLGAVYEKIGKVKFEADVSVHKGYIDASDEDIYMCFKKELSTPELERIGIEALLLYMKDKGVIQPDLYNKLKRIKSLRNNIHLFNIDQGSMDTIEASELNTAGVARILFELRDEVVKHFSAKPAST